MFVRLVKIGNNYPTSLTCPHGAVSANNSADAQLVSFAYSHQERPRLPHGRGIQVTGRDSSGRFGKGYSGNPGGRAKGDGWVREQLSKSLPRCLEVANELLEHPDGRIRIAAVKEILDRVIGKAAQAVEVSGMDGGAVRLIAAIDRPPPAQSYDEWLERWHGKAE